MRRFLPRSRLQFVFACGSKEHFPGQHALCCTFATVCGRYATPTANQCILTTPMRCAHTASSPPTQATPAQPALPDPVTKYHPRTDRCGGMDLVVLGPDGGAFREDIELLAQYELLYCNRKTEDVFNALQAFIKVLPKQFSAESVSSLHFLLSCEQMHTAGNESRIYLTDSAVAAAMIEVPANREPTSPAANPAEGPSPPKLFLALNTRVYNVPAPRSDLLVYKGWWVVRIGGLDKDEAKRTMAFLSQCLSRFALARAVATEYTRLEWLKRQEGRPPSHFASFFDQQVELTSALRPYPVHGVIPAAQYLSPHRIENEAGDPTNYTLECLESFKRYPFVLNGPSGSGKTVAALQLSEKIVDHRSRRGYMYSSPTSVIGVYVRVKKNIDDAATLEDGPMHACVNVNQLVGEAVRTFVRVVNSFNIVAPAGGHDLRGVHLHVVFDELGSHPRLVRAIVGGHAELCAMVRAALALERTNGGGEDNQHLLANLGGLDGLEITTAIVGAGVDNPASIYEGGSMGKPFWRVRVTTCPLALISTHSHSPTQFAAAVARDPLLSLLARNFRCASLLTLASHQDQYKPFARDLSPVAGNLVRHVAEDYRVSSRWSELTGPGVAWCSALVISLLFTQHPSGRFSGCHLLKDNEISDLVSKLGAVDDRLCWTEQSTLPPIAAPVPDGFHQLFAMRPDTKEGEKMIYPGIRARSIEDALSIAAGSESGAVQRSELLRFHVPASIALLALLFFCERAGMYPLSGEGQSISATFESLTAAAIAALLTVAEARGVSVPAEMLFSSFGRADTPSFDDLALANPKPHPATNIGAGVSFDEKGSLIVSAPYLCRASRRLGFGDIVDRTRAFAVEVATEAAAQSDVVVHADGLTADIECKAYVGGGSVDAKMLLKRCAQKGYRRIHFKVRASRKGNEDCFSVSREVFLFFGGLLRSHSYNFSFDGEFLNLSVRTEKATKRSVNLVACVRSAILRNLLASRSSSNKAVASVKDALIMCGPNAARPLIPAGVSVSFRERRVLVEPLLKSNDDAIKFEHDVHNSGNPMRLSFRVDEEVSAPVICWAFSLPLLLSSTTDGALQPQEAVGGIDGGLFDATIEDKTETVEISRARSATSNFLRLR